MIIKKCENRKMGKAAKITKTRTGYAVSVYESGHWDCLELFPTREAAEVLYKQLAEMVAA